MKTAYTIIEPGHPLRVEADELTWNDVAFEKGEPSLRELDRLLLPMFDAGRHYEHVSVNGYRGPTDMFVDDMGMVDGQPLNLAATVIYWTALAMHGIAQEARGPLPSFDEMRKQALRLGVDRLQTDVTSSRIHGRAILLRDRVWF